MPRNAQISKNMNFHTIGFHQKLELYTKQSKNAPGPGTVQIYIQLKREVSFECSP